MPIPRRQEMARDTIFAVAKEDIKGNQYVNFADPRLSGIFCISAHSSVPCAMAMSFLKLRFVERQKRMAAGGSQC